MDKHLGKLKNVEYNGVRELARAAEQLLRNLGTSQDKLTVAEFPNERTIRYYITEGLLDQAIKKRGVSSVFGYEHLLTLLTIKKLQSNGLPISVIKTLISDKSIDELEKLFGEDVTTIWYTPPDLPNSAGYVPESEIAFALMSSADPKLPKENEAKEYLQSLLLDPDRTAPSVLKHPATSSPPNLPTGTSDWRRYEIVPGIELHVSRTFRPPKDQTYFQRILVLIDGILHSRESK